MAESLKRCTKIGASFLILYYLKGLSFYNDTQKTKNSENSSQTDREASKY